MFTLPSFKKKKLKDKKKKKGGWFKRRFYLWEKSSSWPCSSVFYSCPKSKSMVLRKPVPRSKNLVVSYRKEENPTFSTDTTYCSVQHFLCQKKKKKKKRKEKKKKTRFELELPSAFRCCPLVVSDDGLLIAR